MSYEEVKQFYADAKKTPHLYGYDEEGNLIQRGKKGEIVKTIPLPVYRAPTYEEYDSMEEKRAQEIADASKTFNDAKKRLRELYLVPAGERSMMDVIMQNRAVEQADRTLQNIRFPLRYVEKIKPSKVPIGSYDMTQPDNKHNNPSQVVILHTRPYTLQEQYVREGQAPAKPLKSLAEIQAAAAKQAPTVLFWKPSTNDNGFLSLDWAVVLNWKGQVYQSAKQAIYAELAKSFQDQASLEKIMSAESADDIMYSVEDVPGEANEVKWNAEMKRLLADINLLKFTQYPELALRLLQTQEAKIGAYIPDDNLLGIGISIDNVQSQNPMNWTGQNLLGQTLMDIRRHVKEQELAKQAAVAAPAPVPAPVPAKPKPKLRIPKENNAVPKPRTIRRAPSMRPEEQKESSMPSRT